MIKSDNKRKTKGDNMNYRFEKLRCKLHTAIDKYGINSKETREISKKFDGLVNSYYEKERQYPENSLMRIKYLESLNILRKITRDFSKFPSTDEWNKYAGEKGLLCTESLKYITGINWHQLRNRIKSEI